MNYFVVSQLKIDQWTSCRPADSGTIRRDAWLKPENRDYMLAV